MLLDDRTPFQSGGISLLNLQDGETVHQRAVLAHGQVDSWAEDHADIEVLVHQGDADRPSHPPTLWPTSRGHFKTVMLLDPGANVVSFRPRLRTSTAYPARRSIPLEITLEYQPLQTPPLHLAILLASDSPMRIDCPPSKGSFQSHASLDAVVSKFRTAAYLWQALTAQCALANGLGRRSFRLDEYFEGSTSASLHAHLAPRIHLIRTRYTTAQLQSPDLAQQNPHARQKSKLYDIFLDALATNPGPIAAACRSGQDITVAGLILDAHYLPSRDLIVAHAALGGNGGPGGHIHLGMFGSHLAWSWPRSIGEVAGCLLDATPPTPRTVGNDAGECGTAWESAAIGLGAMLHEVGHAFGCPHQPYGVMARGYVDFPRSFLSQTAYSSRLRQPGLILVTVHTPNNNVWHLNDLLIFRGHPAFWMPGDRPISSDAGLAVNATASGVSIESEAGISTITWSSDGRQLRAERPQNAVPSVHVSILELESMCPRSEKLTLQVTSLNGKISRVEDVWIAIDMSRISVHGESWSLEKRQYRGHHDDGQSLYHWAALLPEFQGGRLEPPLQVGRRNGAWLDGIWILRSGNRPDSSPPSRKADGQVHRAGGSSYTTSIAPNEHIIAVHVVTGGSFGIRDVQFETERQRQKPARSAYSLVAPQGFWIVGLTATHILDNGYCPTIEVGILCAPVDARITPAAAQSIEQHLSYLNRSIPLTQSTSSSRRRPSWLKKARRLLG